VNPTADEKKRRNDTWRPKFVIRFFDQKNSRYIKQLKQGSSWTRDFDQQLRDFNPNDYDSVEKNKKWATQAASRSCIDHKKRETRKPFEAHEVRALREHFNELIKQGGVITTALTPNWDLALERVNQTRLDRDPTGALRALKQVTAKGKEDKCPPEVASLGIAEWLDFGMALATFQNANRDLEIEERLLKPRRAISLDDVPGTASYANKDAREKARKDLGPKLTPVAQDGEIIVHDRFDGTLVAGLFSQQEDTDEEEVEETEEQQRAGHRNKRKDRSYQVEESDEDATESEDGERSPKRRK
jgi:hypothetical protein